MEKILMLGGSGQQVVAINTAKRMGLFTILCDYLPDNPGQYHADKFYQISTTDKDAVLKVARDEKINYIIAYASDPAAPTAAYVAEKLGLPTNPYAAVEILCNKDKFRHFLSTHGFCTPKAKGYDSKELALTESHKFNYPIIIKPVDSSGSKGVTVLKDELGFGNAIEFAMSYSRTKKVIIEEYIEKAHPYLIGGDIFVSNGTIIQWGLMNCHRDPNVNPLVPVGKSYPPLIDSRGYERIQKALQKLVSELGIQFGPMNVEVIVDANGHVFLIDVGPRCGGNMIPDLLGLIFNNDVVEMSIKAAMGQNVQIRNNNVCSYFATLNLHSNREGVLRKIDFDPRIEQYIVRKNIYKKPGDKIHYFTNAADALGIVFFHFPNQETMLNIEEEMTQHVKIQVE